MKTLSKSEGFEQAQYRLVCTAEEREDWLEEEEARRAKAKLKRREANNRSQQKLQEQKYKREIADGLRDTSGKVKKVRRHTV